MIDKREHLNRWLEIHKDQPIRVMGITSIGASINWGVNPDPYPWIKRGKVPVIENFQPTHRGSLHIRVKRKWYELIPSRLPQDRWGNTATVQGGLNSGTLVACRTPYREDYTGLDNLFKSVKIDVRQRGLDPDKFETWLKFLNWVRKELPWLMSTVQDYCNFRGKPELWTYFTTDRSITGKKWKKAAKRFSSLNRFNSWLRYEP